MSLVYGILTLCDGFIWHNNLLLVVLIKSSWLQPPPSILFWTPTKKCKQQGMPFLLPTYLPTNQQPTFLYTNHLSFICSHNNHLPIVLLGTYYLQEFSFFNTWESELPRWNLRQTINSVSQVSFTTDSHPNRLPVDGWHTLMMDAVDSH
jgi:hypothetical protein